MRTSKSMLFVAAAGLLALGLALELRYGLVEAEGLGIACTQLQDTRCNLRQAVITTFTHNRLGYLSLVSALLALLTGLRPSAWIGWLAGIAGLVLYCFDTSAVGTLLSLLILARPAKASTPHNNAQATA